jgi:hypothetical protein
LATTRTFCRFAKGDGNTLGVREIPNDGFCISAFLVISDSKNPRSVLLGKVDPAGPWDHLGAMFPDLVNTASKGWMLPSSHIILFESPHDASRRILSEQLGLQNLELAEPKIFSDVYDQKGRKNHWDLQMVYRGTAASDIALKREGVWTELKFVNLDSITTNDLVRTNGDILANVGLHVGA